MRRIVWIAALSSCGLSADLLGPLGAPPCVVVDVADPVVTIDARRPSPQRVWVEVDVRCESVAFSRVELQRSTHWRLLDPPPRETPPGRFVLEVEVDPEGLTAGDVARDVLVLDTASPRRRRTRQALRAHLLTLD